MDAEIRYADSGGARIAYQVVGSGPRDLVLVHGWVTNLELLWEHPVVARTLERLASFSRLIHLDKRGTGLSDRVPLDQLPALEQRMDDVRAVLDAAGSERAVLFGYSEGGPLCALFAAAYPERTERLIMYGSYASRVWSPDYPWAPTRGERSLFFTAIEQGWGGTVDLDILAPSRVNDEAFAGWWSRFLRSSASPSAALALARMNTAVDVRMVLPTIGVPTLVIQRSDDRDVFAGNGQWMAKQIPDATYVELPGQDHLLWADPDPIIDAVEAFVTGGTASAVPKESLITILITDLVGSTRKAAELGDIAWRHLLDRHDALVRHYLQQYRGREINTTGDGFVAAFGGPARAVRCAQAIAAAVNALNLEIRSGVHTGACERQGEDIRGLAIHTCVRVAALAEPGEVLVSPTVKDLAADSGIEFHGRGTHRLKGVPGRWNLYAAT
jgi:pimeloyl-ACP methyl ester carboxylesterase